MKRAVCSLLLLALTSNVFAGLTFVRSNGITLTGADGITLTGADGITLTGADGLLPYRANGITLTGADGITLTGADSIRRTAADGATYTGGNGITLTGADGITLTGADGITLTGADGVTLTGADGRTYTANAIAIRRPDGITLTGADGITLTGADGITLTGADGISSVGPNAVAIARANGITLTGADGITLTGADGITLTGADGFTGFGPAGVLFENNDPSGITLTGADGITLTGADGITLTGADGITLTGADARLIAGLNEGVGMQGLDPDLAVRLNTMTDDSNVNAIIAYHRPVTDGDITSLQNLGIAGGTRMRVLPFVYVSATRNQLVGVSRLTSVRSIYGNRTLNFNADPYFDSTGVQRVAPDSDLRALNILPVTGRDVTVAVLDTGINALHGDLAGKVVQNVRLADLQSVPPGFTYPIPTENLANTDLVGGHGTFVAGIIAGSGAASGGRYAGVAPGAKLLGLSAGDINLISVLSGFDYLLEKGPQYSVRAVNCSFSAATAFDLNDPVNIATRLLTANGISVVFSAGNTGPGNGTLNPYAAAPWVIGVGATDNRSRLADFSSRGDFADDLQHPLVVAPGVSIVGARSLPSITSVGGVAGADTNRLSPLELSYYTTASGTSFSAPQVAGAIALMLDANPNLSPADIRDIIGRTASPLPKNFYHEVGAGVLNTHAAVLEAGFPDRRMGAFRSQYTKNTVRFVTSDLGSFVQSVFPHVGASQTVTLPTNTVQAGVTVAWNLSANDFGLRLFDNADGSLLGTSNNLNLPGITGRSERVILRNPASLNVRAEVRNSFGIGTTQNVLGSVKVTRVEYPELVDIIGLPPAALAEIQSSLVSTVMLPDGRRFGPQHVVLRSDFADAFLRTGLVSQYVAGSPMFSDVRNIRMRGAVESVQSNPDGKLFIDATTGGRFFPYSKVSKLIAAVAYVRAAKLESLTATTPLPLSVADAGTIPVSLRGYVAVALQRGFISMNGNLFSPSRSITRLELATSLNRLVGGEQ